MSVSASPERSVSQPDAPFPIMDEAKRCIRDASRHSEQCFSALRRAIQRLRERELAVPGGPSAAATAASVAKLVTHVASLSGNVVQRTEEALECVVVVQNRVSAAAAAAASAAPPHPYCTPSAPHLLTCPDRPYSLSLRAAEARQQLLLASLVAAAAARGLSAQTDAVLSAAGPATAALVRHPALTAIVGPIAALQEKGDLGPLSEWAATPSVKAALRRAGHPLEAQLLLSSVAAAAAAGDCDRAMQLARDSSTVLLAHGFAGSVSELLVASQLGQPIPSLSSAELVLSALSAAGIASGSSSSFFVGTFEAGLMAIAAGVARPMQTSSNPTDPLSNPSIVALAQTVAPSTRRQSSLLCRISGLSIDEENIPLLLPTGSIFGSVALARMQVRVYCALRLHVHSIHFVSLFRSCFLFLVLFFLSAPSFVNCRPCCSNATGTSFVPLRA